MGVYVYFVGCIQNRRTFKKILRSQQEHLGDNIKHNYVYLSRQTSKTAEMQPFFFPIRSTTYLFLVIISCNVLLAFEMKRLIERHFRYF